MSEPAPVVVGTPLPRTPEEILVRLKQVEILGHDTHGLERSRLLDALPYSMAREYLQNAAGWNEEEWEQNHRTTTKEAVLASLVDWLPHAWNRANGQRATSAYRSVAHACGALWLLGSEHDALVAQLTASKPVTEGYFGKRELVQICEAVSFSWREHDDGRWYTPDDGASQSPLPPVDADTALGRK